MLHTEDQDEERQVAPVRHAVPLVWRRAAIVAIAAMLIGAASACGGGSGTSGETGTPPTAGCSGPRTATTTAWPTPMEPAPVPTLPVTVTDVAGDQITITDTSRILALDTYGTLATTVYSLGLGDHLVGRDISTGIPALADLPLVTVNGHELNAEAILDLYPSVVLTDYSIGPLEVQLQLKAAGIPVVILDDHRSKDSIGPQIREVGHVLGVDVAGKTLAERVEQDVAAAEHEVAELASRQSSTLRMAFLYLRGNAGVYQWFGEGSGADDLIRALGGVDVAGEVGVDGYRPINAEGLVRAAPDLLLLMTDGLKSVGGVGGLVQLAGVGETSAGLRRCVVDMADSQILSFGPQFPATLRALGAAVYRSDPAS